MVPWFRGLGYLAGDATVGNPPDLVIDLLGVDCAARGSEMKTTEALYAASAAFRRIHDAAAAQRVDGASPRVEPPEPEPRGRFNAFFDENVAEPLRDVRRAFLPLLCRTLRAMVRDPGQLATRAAYARPAPKNVFREILF